MRVGSLLDILGWGHKDLLLKYMQHLVTFVCSSNFLVDCQEGKRAFSSTSSDCAFKSSKSQWK